MSRSPRLLSILGLGALSVAAAAQGPRDASTVGFSPAPLALPAAARVAPAPRTAQLPELFSVERGFTAPALDPRDVRVTEVEGLTETGRVYETVIDPASYGEWTSLPDGGMVWTVRVQSPNASSLRFRFDDFRIPHGAELILYSADDPTRSYGPYGSERRRPGLSFWSPTIRSNRVNIEFYIPAEIVERGGPEAPAISAVLQGFPNRGGAERGDDCRIDVTTNASWADEALGVAYLEFVSGGSSLICSGSLVTRLPSWDNTPLLLTAGHCISTEAEANSVQAYWFYQSDMFPDEDDAPSSLGATLLAVDVDADNSLLAILDVLPDGVHYNGWNTEWVDLGWNGTIIHHPAGTQKAISYGEFQAYTVCACGNCWNTWFFPLSNGGQEGGSSGAPVFRNLGRQIRAVASCSTNENCGPNEWTWEGSFRHAYDTLEPFLDARTDVWVDVNHGGTERGTQAQPWDEIIEGYYGVFNGGTIHLVGGSYPAFNFLGDRAMLLTAEGGSAVIGE